MNTHVGRCGLCRNVRELRDSHLLPAASYKLSRIESRSDPNPVVVSKRRSVTTSRQVSDYFLCSECEDKFSRNGERYVFHQCARRGGEFKLREILAAESPVCVDAKFKIYDVARLLGTRVDQYIYFAASVFWRASAHRWTFDGRTLDLISCGSRYQEEFRRYLLGEAAFPENGRIFVHVWDDVPIEFTTITPTSFRVECMRRHKFCIPGITFILFLGGEVSKKHDQAALNSTKGNYMWACRWHDDSLFESFRGAITDSQPSASLLAKVTKRG